MKPNDNNSHRNFVEKTAGLATSNKDLFHKLMYEAECAEIYSDDDEAYFILSEIADNNKFTKYEQAAALLYRSYIYFKLDLIIASEADVHNALLLSDKNVDSLLLETQRKKYIFSQEAEGLPRPCR